MSTDAGFGRLVAALAFAILLFVPIVLAGMPVLPRSAVPGPFARTDLIVAFFVAVPALFVALAAYRVAQYHGVLGADSDEL